MSGDGYALVSARRRSALVRALGPAVAHALGEADVVEALVNADGRLWLDRLGRGLEPTAHTLSIAERETAIRLLAHEAGETVGAERPALSTILPDSAARVQALLPPLVEAPVIAIRNDRRELLNSMTMSQLASQQGLKPMSCAQPWRTGETLLSPAAQAPERRPC